MRLSVVWVIPILAAVVAIGIAIQRILSEGPTITIVLEEAQGIEAGNAFIRYKDVNIGQVTRVELAPDYARVLVTAKIAKSAAGLMVEDARFWVVEPRISLSGVSGLSTLLSGNYIGFEAGKSDKPQRAYTALKVPPSVTAEQPGRKFRLKADNLGSLGVGSPIYYRRLPAGQVLEYAMAADGKAVDLKIFVDAPYDRFVYPETRFWNASGLDVSLGANGLDVRTESLVALIAGGLAFDTPAFAPQDEAAAAETVFTLFGDRQTAMKQPDAISVRYLLHFTESLRGLSVGAPVTILGLVAGEVTNVGLDLDPVTKNLRGRVELVSYPERIVARVDANRAAAVQAGVVDVKQRQAFFQYMVEERQLRGQLRTGSLITGELYVAFDFFPDAPKAQIDWSQEPTELPVVPSTLSDLQAKASDILTKLDALPYEAIGADIKQALVTFDKLLQDTDTAVNRIDAEITPDLKAALDSFRGALAEVDKVLADTDSSYLDKNAQVQQDLREALSEIARAARSISALADYLERHPESLIRGKSEGN